MRAKKLLHSCHSHPITEITFNPGVLDCSCCELDLSGQILICYERQCNIEPKPLFCIHKSCAELPQKIRHKTHPAHDLTLLRTHQQAGGGTCNACGEAGGTGSSYNCSTCDYHLHVKCSSLPEVVIRDDHEHSLRLVYSFQNNADDVDLLCDLCADRIKHGYWAYCCARCDVFAHLKCAKQALKVGENEQVVASQPHSEATQALINTTNLQQQIMTMNLAHSNQRHHERMMFNIHNW